MVIRIKLSKRFKLDKLDLYGMCMNWSDINYIIFNFLRQFIMKSFKTYGHNFVLE